MIFPNGAECECSKCRKTFHQDAMKQKELKIYNTIINIKVCPYCGSNGYTALRDMGYFYRKMETYKN